MIGNYHVRFGNESLPQDGRFSLIKELIVIQNLQKNWKNIAYFPRVKLKFVELIQILIFLMEDQNILIDSISSLWVEMSFAQFNFQNPVVKKCLLSRQTQKNPPRRGEYPKEGGFDPSLKGAKPHRCWYFDYNKGVLFSFLLSTFLEGENKKGLKRFCYFSQTFQIKTVAKRKFDIPQPIIFKIKRKACYVIFRRKFQKPISSKGGILQGVNYKFGLALQVLRGIQIEYSRKTSFFYSTSKSQPYLFYPFKRGFSPSRGRSLKIVILFEYFQLPPTSLKTFPISRFNSRCVLTKPTLLYLKGI
eukprot:TRINITY_DN8170_c0_g1_i5.p1 TRINITY_DN8170_c0_g1~~TRINITY_DN8170_c0_g1_i5.p1  ORF type:complete len:303 (+),score=13.82 TRINITY_DN8170_c0_g1_i5:150-1058(+)